MAVSQEKSIIKAIETLTNNSQQSELHVGQHFISWPSAIAYISEWCNLQGCKAYINLSRPEKNNVNQYVFVTTIVNEYCHELNYQLINYTKETVLTREMIEDIKFLTLQVHLTITQQRVYLEKKYFEQKIQSDILRYEIQKYWPSHWSK
ncbi:hypothetical protein C1646_821572 [Rhizophagus diaphanus]|nr:hypothetical protein C1646_821572 [Rhizophagus diaphanus] [Rhizophagus sp. MUCL 43196]